MSINMLILSVLLGVISTCYGYNILVVFPVPDLSHSDLGESIVNVIVDAGHQVTFVTPFPKESNLQHLTYVNISSVLEQLPDSKISYNGDVSANAYLPLHRAGARITQRALLHPAVQELMKNTSVSFDAVLVDWFYTGLMAPLASVFECPLIWYSSGDVSGETLGLVHEATNPADHAVIYGTSASAYSLSHRIYQIWSQFYSGTRNYFHFNNIELTAYEESYKDVFEAREIMIPNYESLVYNGSFLLVNSHPPVNQRLPLPLNVKHIGGHHIKESEQPLPKNLRKLLNDSEHGVIYVNLEPHLFGTKLRESTIEALIEVFGQLEQTVIWKYERDLEDLPNNVYMMKKPPQRSILKHKNTIIFINHGDMLSILEATQYGIPVIGIPTVREQIANMGLMEKNGCCVKIDFTQDFVLKIRNAVYAIWTNLSYEENAKTSKSIFRRRLISPQDEIPHWIESVVATQGAPHLRSPTPHLSIFERNNLDIIVVVLLICWFLSKLVKAIRVTLQSSSEDSLNKKDD